MLRSLGKRLLRAIILLGIISILAFWLSKHVPGDEVLDYLSIDDTHYSAANDLVEQRISYAEVAHKRGLDLPFFYFSITKGYYPDSLFSIVVQEERAAVERWIAVSKNKKAALLLHHDLVEALTFSCSVTDTSISAISFCQPVNSMLRDPDIYSIQRNIKSFHSGSDHDPMTDTPSSNILSRLNRDIELLIDSPGKLAFAGWLPAIHWHGTHNQYHRWITGLVTFQPLISLIDGRNAWSKIGEALKWTLLLNGFAFLLAMILGISIGIWSGTHDGRRAERFINIILFILFALPSFWLATLLVAFLTSGEWLSLFPSGGLGPYQEAGNVFARWGILISHLILPVICLAAGSLAYISRQMKQSITNQLKQPYVLSLRTQGISARTILRRHVIRNSLFPLITLIGGSLPALISGSLIIEVIFSIPGMGRLMYTGLVARDWPVVFPILMLGAAVTVLVYIMTDVVYKWADPRVKSIDP